jgi:hypothetical protein
MVESLLYAYIPPDIGLYATVYTAGIVASQYLATLEMVARNVASYGFPARGGRVGEVVVRPMPVFEAFEACDAAGGEGDAAGREGDVQALPHIVSAENTAAIRNMKAPGARLWPVSPPPVIDRPITTRYRQ